MEKSPGKTQIQGRIHTVAAHPSSYSFDAAHVALLCIDFQRDFLEPGGFGHALGNDVSPLRAAIEPTAAVLDYARDQGWLVVHTREGHRPDLSDLFPAKRDRGTDRGTPAVRIGERGPMGRLLVRGAPGHEIIEELAPHPGETIVDKPGKGAFYGTDLETILRAQGITHLILTGVTTEVCVQSTVREANDRGFQCLVLTDCTGSYFPAFHEAALAMFSAQGGIVGWTAESTDLLQATTDQRPHQLAGSDLDIDLDDELLFVNGTLMHGLELHPNLDGAQLLEETTTASCYRVHTINDVHPGMYRARHHEMGVAIAGELYRVPLPVLLDVLAGEPAGLYRGAVELADGRVVPGILYDRLLAQTHPDITAYGGWRRYRTASVALSG
ncbi:MAG: isochorismatase family protein [Dietzia maris]